MTHFNETIRKNNPFDLTKAMILAIMVMLSFVPQLVWAANYTWSNSTPPTVANGDAVTIGGTPTGTLNVPSGVTVTINGSVAGVTTGLTLNIGSGATVQWSANFQAATSTTSSYCVNLNGSGTLVVSSCTIANTKSGGVINVIGTGATLTIGAGAVVSSGGTNGNAVLISSNNATVNVNAGGLVESADGNSAAAIQTGSGATNPIGVTINVDGGSVVSIGAGNAIFDGAGGSAGVSDAVTVINVNSGSVIAGTTSAIRSTGMTSSVVVNGGIVSNAASNNIHPAINMVGGDSDDASIFNVVINGGTVQSTSNAGYALQTAGNVLVKGGLISAINGRAINITGMTSIAQIDDGLVQTTGNGTAISTATTDPTKVKNASIKVTGGTVSSASGYAINITGENSKVEISGNATVSTAANTSSSSRHAINADGLNSEIIINGNAVVSAADGYAINTITNATNAEIHISGNAKVSSSTNRAINTLGVSASVEVSETSQVWTFSVNNAIYSAGTVTLTGGFVFAYGANANSVINSTLTVPAGSETLVVAWDRAANVWVYSELNQSHNQLSNAHNGGIEHYWWHNVPPYKGGIEYAIGGNTGFFQIPGVAVVKDAGLMFDAANGNMYYNVDGTNTLTTNNINNPYPLDVTWSGVQGKLTLNGLSWNTGAAAALTIVNGAAIVELADGSINTLVSHPFSTVTTSYGIRAETSGSRTPVEISGNGILEALGDQYGVYCSDLKISGGTIEASGSSGALFNVTGSVGTSLNPLDLPDAYTYWRNTASVDPPGGVGTQYYYDATVPIGISFSHRLIPPTIYNRYVKIVSGAFVLIDDVTITGTVGKSLTPQTAVITIYGDMVNGGIDDFVDSWFTNLPGGVRVKASAAIGSSTITLEFQGTPAVTSKEAFEITIPGKFFTDGVDREVIYNPEAKFNVCRVPHYLKPANGIFYVKEGGTGDGSSWANAYSNVADPLMFAAKQHSGLIHVVDAADDRINEIWVAKGTYFPMYDTDGYDMSTQTFPESDGGRDNSFVLVKDVKLYGGFPPDANDMDNAPNLSVTKDKALATRNWYNNPTILSGDLEIAGDNSDNAHHVVISSGDAGTALLDGFIISGGNADEVSNISVNSNVIDGNRGGGICHYNSSPALTNVVISGNAALNEGGGMYYYYSYSVLTNVRISGNTANTLGGGMYNNASSPVLTNVTISGNNANEGGGIYNNLSDIIFRNSIIYGNTATDNANINNVSSISFFSHSLIENSLDEDSNWILDFCTDEGGNIDTDPRFADAANGDFRLQPGSPAINVGDNNFFHVGESPDLSAITTDLAGNVRILTIVDVGAYEAYEYIITATAYPTAGGNVSISGTSPHIHGQSVTVSATPEEGYRFENWTVGGAVVSTNAIYTFNAIENLALVANFVRKTYTITVSDNPAGAALSLTVNGGGTSITVEHGEQITVEAVADDHFIFVNWQETDGSVMDNDPSGIYTFTATGDINLVANFVEENKYLLTLEVSPVGAGSVTGGGSYFNNNKALIEAIADNANYEFVAWMDGDMDLHLNAFDTYTVTGEENKILTALFRGVEKQITVTVEPPGSGTVTGAGTYRYGETATLNVSHGDHYLFVSWKEEGNIVHTNSTYSFLVTDDRVLTANLELITHTITASIDDDNGTIVQSGIIDVTHGENRTYTFESNQGFHISQVLIDGVNDPTAVSSGSYTFSNVTANHIIVVSFAIDTYTITASVNGGNGTISPSGVINVDYDGSQSFSITPNTDYHITQVKIDGVNDPVAVANGSYTFTNVDENHTIEVFFVTIHGSNKEIDNIVVDGEQAVRTGYSFSVLAACGSNSVNVTVTTEDPNAAVKIDGVAYQNPHIVNLPNYGNNDITIKVIAENGIDEQTYTLTIYKRLPFWDKDGGLVVMHWNNTLSIINNPTVNSDFDFRNDSYRWFRVGETQPFNTNQWWSAGAQGETLSTAAEYYVEATNTAGKLLITCPGRITLVSMNLKALPNPVATGQTLYIEADVDEELLKGAVIEVYDVTGNRVDYLQAQGRLTPVNVRYATGVYVFVLRGADGFTKELKVVVK